MVMTTTVMSSMSVTPRSVRRMGSFTTIAVAAKNVMTSVPNYLVIETAFTVVQWAIVGPLTAAVFARPVRTEPAPA
jgi:hypothetical protein